MSKATKTDIQAILKKHELDSVQVEYVNDFRERGHGLNVTLNVPGRSLTFDELAKISVAFGTKKINVSGIDGGGGGCETCGYGGSEGYVEVDVLDIKLPTEA